MKSRRQKLPNIASNWTDRCHEKCSRIHGSRLTRAFHGSFILLNPSKCKKTEPVICSVIPFGYWAVYGDKNGFVCQCRQQTFQFKVYFSQPEANLCALTLICGSCQHTCIGGSRFPPSSQCTNYLLAAIHTFAVRINSQPARTRGTHASQTRGKPIFLTDRQTAGSSESRGRWEGNYPWQTYLCRFHLLPASLQPALITVTVSLPPLKGFNWKIKVF